MKRSNLIKFSALALFAVIVLAAFDLLKKSNSKPGCIKCCLKECKPEPKSSNTDFIFYESVSGHPIAATFKQ